ncbi:hypothetical protein [Cupriavidus consociatus]|uniref:hypothetical protein n=1 Tax=Cupriavidus consociatus TaxID=2821357 RepID=UPI001FD7B855|nr:MULTISPECIES: hypothetical protein [unclassified Cupriavidus]MDK2662189.1 hypothetical protein [Cupriavidus sp. LEh21]
MAPSFPGLSRFHATMESRETGAWKTYLEACGGAHDWARRFMAMGHQVQMIAPKFVKPFVQSQKNGSNDAEAIVEAASRPTMRYVAINGIEQQDIQCMHRIRSLLMRDRIAQINFLAEYGIVISQSALQVQRRLPEIIADTTTGADRIHQGNGVRHVRAA